MGARFVMNCAPLRNNNNTKLQWETFPLNFPTSTLFNHRQSFPMRNSFLNFIISTPMENLSRVKIFSFVAPTDTKLNSFRLAFVVEIAGMHKNASEREQWMKELCLNRFSMLYFPPLWSFYCTINSALNSAKFFHFYFATGNIIFHFRLLVFCMSSLASHTKKAT